MQTQLVDPLAGEHDDDDDDLRSIAYQSSLATLSSGTSSLMSPSGWESKLVDDRPVHRVSSGTTRVDKSALSQRLTHSIAAPPSVIAPSPLSTRTGSAKPRADLHVREHVLSD